MTKQFKTTPITFKTNPEIANYLIYIVGKENIDDYLSSLIVKDKFLRNWK